MERNDSRQDAARPPDHGLAALGLIMQLGGAIFLVWMVVDTAERVWPQAFGNHDAPISWLSLPVVVLAAAAARSALHVRAGLALVRRTGVDRLAPTVTYLIVAFVQPSTSSGSPGASGSPQACTEACRRRSASTSCGLSWGS